MCINDGTHLYYKVHIWLVHWNMKWNLGEKFSNFSYGSMNRENRPPVTYGLVEFEKWLVKIEDFKKITNRFRGINGIYFNSIKEIRKTTTCNRLDLETLGCNRLCPKIFLGIDLGSLYDCIVLLKDGTLKGKENMIG